MNKFTKYISWLVIFAVVEIALALFLTFLREDLWNAISTKYFAGFMHQIYIFTGAALTICFVSGMSGYLVSLSGIEWRKRLNKKALDVPKQTDIENLPQRVQSDCLEYPDLMLSLGYGLIKSIFYILVFSISMLMSFSLWYLIVLIGYTIIGTTVTHFIAKPLIKLNYNQQRVEATYRQDLLCSSFKDCVRLMLGLAKKQKNLTYWQQFYGQISVVVPLLLIAPAYFINPAFTLGLLMRFNSLSATLLDNMSFGISSFGQFNRLLSCRKRLKEINVI